jgi:hypothetical protein
MGLFLTPFWVAFHDGTFDLFDLGAPASSALEVLAEDGDTGPLSGQFAASPSAAAGGLDATVLAPAGFPVAPVCDPGERATVTLNLDPVANRYFSYASMVIPSNDAFIANEDSLAHPLFDDFGNVIGSSSFVILGGDVLDAGTEDNTEMQAAFINQTGPNMGPTTVGGVVVSPHPGFIGSLGNPGGAPTILGGTTAAGTLIDPNLGDFTRPGFQVAFITTVPTPTAFGGAGLCLVSLLLCHLLRTRLNRRV